MKKTLKIFAYILSGILVLLAVLLFVISTGWFNNSIKKYASNFANQMLNADLSFSKIDGNPLGHFYITDISLKKNGEILANADTLEIGYRLLPMLRKKVVVHKIRLGNVNLNLEQERDSLWNIMKIMPKSDTTTTTQDKTPFSWEIDLRDIAIDSFHANIQSLETANFIPQKIGLSLQMGMKMIRDSMVFNLQKLPIIAEHPDLVVEKLNGDIIYASNSITWENVEIKLPNSYLKSGGTLPLQNLGLIRTKTEITPLSFNDIRDWLMGAPIQGKPDIQLSLDGNIEKNNLFASISEDEQSIVIKGWVNNFTTLPEYDLNATMKGIDASHWTGNSLYKTDITGKLSAAGQGFDPKLLTVTTKGDFEKLVYRDYKLNKTTFSITKTEAQAKGNLDAETWVGQVGADFQATDIFDRIKYNIHSTAKGIDLAPLTGIKPLNSSINLDIAANGTGIDPKNLSALMKVKSANSTITGEPIEDFNTSVFYGNGRYSLKALRLVTPFFSLNADGEGDIRKQNHLDFDFSTLNFDKLLQILDMGKYSLSGSITGQADGTKDAFSVQSSAKINKLKTDSISLSGLMLNLGIEKRDTFLLNSTFQLAEVTMDKMAFEGISGNLKLDFLDHLIAQLELKAESVKVGNYQPELNFLSQNFLTIEDSIKLSSTLDAKNVKSELFTIQSLSGNLGAKYNDENIPKQINSGIDKLINQFDYAPLANALSALKNDSLAVASNIVAENLRYDNYSIDKLKLDANAGLRGSNYTGTAELFADSLSLSNIKIKNLNLDTKFYNLLISNNIRFAVSDSLTGFLKVDYLQNKEPTLLLRDLGITSKQFEWNGGSDSTMIVMGKDSISVNHLDINSDGGQYINANGVFAFKGDENFSLSIIGIDLGEFDPFVKSPIPLNGKAHGKLSLTGTSAKPIIDANLRLDNYKIDTTLVDSLVVSLNYLDELFVSKGHINIGKNQSVVADLKFPLRISFEDSIRFPNQGDIVAANMQITNFDLAIVNSLMPNSPITVDGLLNSKFIVDGPFKTPDINGNLDLEKGKLDYNEYGVHYKNIDIKSGIANDSLYLNTFSAAAGSGNFKANGSVKFKPDSLFVPESLDIHLSGQDFKALDSDLIEATVNTQLDISGQYLKPEFKGSLEVLRSNVNADAFLARFDVVGDTKSDPYLVEALKAKGQTIEGKPFVPQKEKISILEQIDINGEFLVEIPGNCWIKGKDMNFEVKGQLKAIVEKNRFSLVGKLDVKRGYYELLGKRFDFESGSITLTGETDINPILDFNIYYSFRNIENVLQKLQLAISGRLKEPLIQFSLDNNQIEEKEAISYLLFGRSSEQLSEGQKSATELSAEGMVKNLAFGQLSSVLKDAMQRSLGLDVVEISGSDNLDQSSLKIGKYVTNNLFLSIQQTFSFNKQTTVNNPTQFGLEYQILRSLFLKATSQSTDAGFDLIYKKDFK